MSLNDTLFFFQPAALNQANTVAALFRHDTKFLLHSSTIPALLEKLKNDFRVLEINGKRQHLYETLYFDTPDFRLFHDHHKGKPNRMKVRVRNYCTTGEVFFEVKHKLKGLQTGKLRLPRQKMMFEISTDEWDAIQSRDANVHGLEKKLITTFQRITLIHLHDDERITIDSELCFNNFKERQCLPDVCVLEVKHTAPQVSSVVKEMMKALDARETSFSKYAIGVALLEKSVKANLFKPAILQLQKLAHGLS